MTDSIAFSFLNVGVGFCVSWLLVHYVLPTFGYERSKGRSTAITLIFTVAALVRNIAVYEWWSR